MNFHLDIIFADPKFLKTLRLKAKKSASLENDDLQT